MPKGKYIKSDIHRKNLSISLKGKKKPWLKGKKRPKYSKEWCENISNGLKGKKWSKERKEKMSKLRKLKNIGNWKGGIWKNDKNYQGWKKRENARKKRLADGSHTFGDWEVLKKQYGYRCVCCSRVEPNIKLTEDHIIPLSKGGSDYIENIQPLCKSCNSKKHTKIIKYI